MQRVFFQFSLTIVEEDFDFYSYSNKHTKIRYENMV